MYWLFPELYTALEEYYETKKLGSGNSTRWLVGHERKGASSRAHAPERGLGAKVFQPCHMRVQKVLFVLNSK